MKQTRTTIQALTSAYRAVLRHGILCNAIALGLIATATPAMATVDRQSVDTTVTWENQNVSNQDFLTTDAVTRDNNPDFGGYTFIDRPGNLTVKDSVYSGLTFDGSGTVFATRIPKDGITASLNIINTNFENNHSLGEGGAIGNYNLLTISDSSFTGNTALLSKNAETGEYTDVVDAGGNGGGALFLGSSSSTSISIANTGFNNNKSATLGGAIATRFATNANGSKNDNSNAKLDIDASFVGNSAEKGGAIYNSFYADNGLGKGDGVTVTGSFSNNTAKQGGAVYNDGDADKQGNGGKMTFANTTFAGNSATKQGGAIYNEGVLALNGGAFSNNSATEGGALFMQAEGLTSNISNVTFDGNSASDGDVGGAITLARGTLNIDNSTFRNNTAGWSGAIFTYSSGNSLNITNSLFEKNSALGAGAVQAMFNTNITNTEFKNNTATTDTDGGGALFVGAVGKAVLDNVTFENNTAEQYRGGAVSTRSADLADNSAAKLDILNSTFTGNTAGTTGGALDNYLYSSRADDVAVYIENSKFASNSADKGGAIYNHGETDHANNTASLKIADSSFAGNTATTAGGAIYNMSGGGLTIAAQNQNVFFGQNRANNVLNDIYNAGTIKLDTSADKTITMNGGIDGNAGTLNITGAGTVEIANALKNQTVAHNSGELHLNNVDLTGSSVAVNSHAVLNSQDGAINNYSSNITLNNDAELLVDANDDGVDKFSIANGATVTLNGVKMLSDLTEDKRTFALADSGTIDAGGALVFTSNHKYKLTGSNDGHLKIAKDGLGGLSAAVGATDEDNYQGILYSLTGNDETITTAAEIKKADVTVIGNNTNAVTLGAALAVGDNSSLVFNGATVNGAGSIENTAGGALGISDSNVAVNINNGGMMGIEDSTIASGKTIENRAGATLTILDSNIGADIMNFGKLISDPTTYTGTVTNAVDAVADFDADTFDTTAVLNNSGVANMTNGVTFNSGAAITGNGLINLVGGTTHFNNTANSNTVKLANGAAFDGALIGGALNTQNGAIDAGLGTIQDANLYVDASLKGAGSIDTFTGTTGSTIKSINVTSTEYGDADSISMNVGGATLDEDLQITGAMNYYTKVEKDGDNLVFSDKLINKSTLDTTLADYATTDAMTTALSGKQDTIDDLATIRSGAAAGATALQSSALTDTALTGNTTAENLAVSGTMTVGGNAVLTSASTLDGAKLTEGSVAQSALSSDVQTLLGKANTALQSGANITALNNDAGYQTASQVSGAITTALGSYSTTAQMNTAIADALTNGSDAYQTASQVDATVSTAISTATIAQSQVTGLPEALDAKLDSATAASTYATQTALTGVGDRVTALEGAGYQTESQVNTAITTALGDYTNTEDMNNAIATALANTNGQGGAYQTETAVATKIADTAAAATYDNSTSGLTATTLQDAIDETASTVATINTNMGKVHGLVSNENGVKTLHETNNSTNTSNVVGGEYKGNLAVGTTVEDHLIALDNAIGTMSALDKTNGWLSNTASVATNLQNLDNAAKSNADAIEDIVDGTTTVAKATDATNAVNATNDGQGRNIASTYATLQLVNDTVGDMATVSGTHVSNTASVATNLNQLSAAIDSISADSIAAANSYTDKRVESLDKNLSAGVAGAVALSSVAVSGVERGEVSVGAGYGYFNGQSAAAVGAAMGLSNRWSINAGAGISNADVSFRAGTNYKFKLF